MHQIQRSPDLLAGLRGPASKEKGGERRETRGGGNCAYVATGIDAPVGWPVAISSAKIIYFASKIYESNFVKERSETVTVRNYQNAELQF